MNIRSFAITIGVCVCVVTAGCASSVAGQAQIASGAVLPTTSRSAPSPFPDPSGGESSGQAGSTEASTTGTGSTTGSGAPESTASTDDTDVSQNPPTPSRSSGGGGDDSSVGPTSATSIPGLSKDCNTVLAGITAFTQVLQGAGASETISQATVDQALQQLPASGLPARPQADISVLRATVSGAAGKTLAELGGKMTDGKVVAALQDLSSWAQDNCA